MLVTLIVRRDFTRFFGGGLKIIKMCYFLWLLVFHECIFET